MFLKKNTNNLRSLFTIFAVFALAVTALWLGANNSITNASTNAGDEQNSPAVVFTGTGLGAIPDSGGGPQAPGTPLDITFNVTGITANVTAVTVNMTFSPAHTYAGDVVATLISPGGTRQLVIFGYTGAITSTSFGDSSDLAGPYTFSDAATGDWWAAAAAAAATAPIPSGSYRTSTIGGSAAGGTPTSLNATFSGLTPAQANGTWTLRVTDGGAGDTGSVSAASLDITATPTGGSQRGRLNDFTGNGRTDFTNLVCPFANAVCPAGGQITWKTLGNPAAPGPNNAFIRIFNYGLTGDGGTLFPSAPTFGDTVVANDYTGDQKTEVAVYRVTTSTYYIAQFPTGAGGIVLERAVPFGNGATDIAGAEGDYDGDGKADYTVVRPNLSGNQTWFIMSSSTGTMRAVVFGSNVGLADPANGAPARVFPGADFNGDGRDELIYATRNDAGTAVTYFVGDAVTGAGLITKTFGNYNSDYSVAPRDYTGDGRADFVAVRETGNPSNQAVWYINNSVTNVTTATPFGVGSFTTGDLPVRGDYDGDGIQDVTVWRPSNQTYYWRNSSNGSLQSQQWGAPNDFPLGSIDVF